MAKFPEPREPEGWEDDAIERFMKEQGVIRTIRNVRAEKEVKPSVKFKPIIVTEEDYDLFTTDSGIIATLSGTYVPEIFQKYEKPDNYIGVVSGSTDIYLPLADLVNPIEERTRLEKELRETKLHIERLEKLLSSDFANKAPAALVQKEREKLAGYKETAEKIRAQLG